MSANRSGKPSKEAPVAPTPPPVQQATPAVEKKYVPKMGDVVLFNYRNPAAPTAITLPMIVTKVHGDGITLDGVALNTNNTGGTMGAICAHGILPGNGEFEWRAK